MLQLAAMFFPSIRLANAAQLFFRHIDRSQTIFTLSAWPTGHFDPSFSIHPHSLSFYARDLKLWGIPCLFIGNNHPPQGVC
jgi:hypothetical protein